MLSPNTLWYNMHHDLHHQFKSVQHPTPRPKMTDSPTPSQAQSRFKAPNNMSTQERISTNTVGLVNLSDFRKRRAEVLEQQEREAREALRSANGQSRNRRNRKRRWCPSATRRKTTTQGLL